MSAAPNVPLYRCAGLSLSHNGKAGIPLPDVTVQRGCVLGLAGPNGAGKSTLLSVLAFLRQPATGLLEFEGTAVTTEKQRRRLRKRVTLLLQQPVLLKRSVLANVAYGLKVRGEPDQKTKTWEALKLVGLDPDRFAHRRWQELSGGEAQRVALAARLALKPQVLLLDEPTASLDTQSAVLVKHAVELARERWGTTMVVASHDLPWLQEISDTVLQVQPATGGEPT